MLWEAGRPKAKEGQYVGVGRLKMGSALCSNVSPLLEGGRPVCSWRRLEGMFRLYKAQAYNEYMYKATCSSPKAGKVRSPTLISCL